MEKLQLNVPNLWADHHVLKARDALTKLKGVENVYASSAWQQILVSYDPTQTAPPAIEQALADAGYPVGEGGAPMLVQANDRHRDPKWEVLGARVATTNRSDIEMSGEFRLY